MELVPGQTLKGPLPLGEALRIAGLVAEALEAAHDKASFIATQEKWEICETPINSR
jgi:hypothetical protein